MDDNLINLNIPTNPDAIIKVIGVGGGGGNAVTNMYKEGIHNVSFALCNTDQQALNGSDVPVKLLLGRTTTCGLGSGDQPERGRAAAEESEEEIRQMLSDGTRMAFITAGMGGGTGTGAAPVVARVSKEMGILTVGIVTIPFEFEGQFKIVQALLGVEEISKNVDALLVINNERVREIYSDIGMSASKAYAKADETLTIAAKSIAEIITIRGVQNLDFADVKTTMKDGGVALMSNGYGEGEGRLQQAIDQALSSPLLNNNDVYNAQRILFNIYSSHDNEFRIDEMGEVHKFMARFRTKFRVKWGFAFDDTLGDKIKITILATGFGLDDIPEMAQQHRAAQELRTEEEQRMEAERRAREESERNLMKKYGYSVNRLRSQVEVVTLTADELDDDTLIVMLEDSPTYNRDIRKINQLRRGGGFDAPEANTTFSSANTNTAYKKSDNNTNSVISFR